MIKSLVLVLFTLLNCSIFGQARIHFSTKTVDYGLIELNSNPYRQIMVTNKGDQPLYIFSCESGCGCAATKCPKAPILPQQSDTLTIRYNTGLLGKFGKKIFITSNDPETPKVEIILRGEVKNNYRINKEKKPIDMIPKGQ